MDLNGGPRRFMTTRWSLVLAAGDPTSPGFQRALATLCEAYWHPVYLFVRRSGYTSDDARDLTQTFFARMLENELLSEAQPHRGRFRSFLPSGSPFIVFDDSTRPFCEQPLRRRLSIPTTSMTNSSTC